MGFIKKNLLPGEKILLDVRLHPALWLLPIVQVVLMVIVVALMLGGAVLIGGTDFAAAGLIPVAIGVVAAGNGLVWLSLIPNHIGVYLSWEMVITNRRIIRKGGLIRRETKELPLDKVESISASHKGIWGRLFGYGEIEVVGMSGARLGITHAVNPMAFRQQAQLILDGASPASSDSKH